MLTLNFEVKNNNLKRINDKSVTNIDSLVAPARNQAEARFTFDSLWRNLTPVIAGFKKGNTSFEQEIKDGKCEIPWEVLDSPGILEIAVAGGDLLTTNSVRIKINDSGIVGGNIPTMSSPGVYSEIVRKADEIEENYKGIKSILDTYEDTVNNSMTNISELATNAYESEVNAAASAKEAAEKVENLEDGTVFGNVVGIEKLSDELAEGISEMKAVDADITAGGNYYYDSANETIKLTTGSTNYYRYLSIDVIPGQLYNIKQLRKHGNISYILFADKSNKLVDEMTNDGTDEKIDIGIYVPVGAVKMYINSYASDIYLYLRTLSAPVATQSYADKAAERAINSLDVTDLPIAEDILAAESSFEAAMTTGGYYYDNNGTITLKASTYWRYITEPLSVNTGDIYRIDKINMNSETVYIIIFTNDDETEIKYGYSTEDFEFNKDNATGKFVKVPEGMTKLYLNCYGTAPKLSKMAYATVATQSYVDSKGWENVPAHYKAHLEEKINEIKAKKKEIGYKGECFIFYTDVHMDRNLLSSPVLMKEICENTGIKNIVFGEDIVSAYGTEEALHSQINKYNNTFGRLSEIANHFAVNGNHDLSIVDNITDSENSALYSVDDCEKYDMYD